MKSYFIFLFLYLSQNFYFSYEHRCGVDLIKTKPFKLSEKKYKRRLSSEYSPIKIKVDYTQLQIQVPSKINFYKERFTNIIKYISSLLSVEHINVDLEDEDIKSYCTDTFGNNAETWLYENDLVLFPYIESDYDDDVLAAASACLILTNYRPVGGTIAINNKILNNRKNDLDTYFEMLVLHELSHVLGFHPYFFENLNLINKETINGVKYTFINSPKVLEKAKIHFNCPNIKGIQLEDQGGEGSEGSHWEARYMLGDYMISTDYPEVVISDITLALFEDLGFYKANYYTGGLFRFGKNQGCSFLEDKCIKNGEINYPNEFCADPNKALCGSSHLSRGYCLIGEYTEEIDSKYRYFEDNHIGGYFSSANYCPVSQISSRIFSTNNYNYPGNCKYGEPKHSSVGEVIGSNSLCFESSLVPSTNSNSDLESVCYEIECNKFKKEINIKIGSSKVVCPGERTTLTNINGFTGSIQCPEYNLICSSEIPCNDMIDCINKKSTSIRSTYLYLKGKILGINNYLILFLLYLLIN